MKNSELRINKVEILGIKVSNPTFEEALHQIEQLVEEGRDGTPKYIVKPNTEIVTYAQDNLEFKKILNLADLAPPDGVGLLFGARLASKPLKERVGGPELTQAILKLSEDKGYSVFFLGARPHVVEKLVKVVNDGHPKLKITGFQHGYFKNDQITAEKIIKSKPDILFVALGFPKQEKWIVDHLSRLKVPLSVAEGGSFDFISGEVHRAPKWMRTVGLEWLFRLIREPSRIRRQLALPKFLWLVLTKR